MLLQKLREYSMDPERMVMPPMLYSETPIRYVIELNAQGRPLLREPRDTADPKERESKRGRRILAPEVQRSAGTKPFLLADSGEYTFGLPADQAKADRAAERHAAYLALLRSCAEATGEPAVKAVQSFLLEDPLGRLSLPADFDASAKVTFTVDHKRVIDIPSVQGFWASHNDPAAKGASTMQCLVCGQQRPVLERLTGKLKGIPGGQVSGTSLISANAEAFESYGLKASLIAPVCADCAERFTKAANDLLGDAQSHVNLGGAAFIYWTREKVAFNPMTFFLDPDEQQIGALVTAVRTGRIDPKVDPVKFYAASLSGSGGRAVVRDWIDTTLGEVKANAVRWFQRQAIVGPTGERAGYLGLFPLAVAAVREARDLSPPTTRSLLRAALLGGNTPMDLLFDAVRRNRAEQKVTRPRAALIKLVLASNQSIKEDTLVELDASNTNPGYRCGRLLAVLEDVQRQAIPGIKATLVSRFYGTASSAPASVFGTLMRGAQPHLAKLQRDKRGAYIALQHRLEDVASGLSEYPKVLSLPDQGLFALGYYHQRAWANAQMRAAAERKRAGKATRQDEELAQVLEQEEENHG